MFHLALTALGSHQGCCEDAGRVVSRRRDRNRATPGAESLEVRDCPSGLLGSAESAHALIAAPHAAAEARHHEAHRAAPSKRVKQATEQTIYVAPKGSLGAAAGKTARHPLGSLTLALKRARPGSTIVLAPGAYTQDAGMTGKSDITIIGAANGASVLAPPGGQALKIYSSSNITIEDVAFRTGGSGGVGLAIAGSSVNLVNVSTDGTIGDGVVVTGYAGQNAVVNAASSHFDASQAGDGMDVQDGATVTINGCTFNDNGTAGGSGGGTGLSVEGNSQATITNSQLVGNTNSDLVGFGQAQVTAQGDTFSDSKKGDGAIFSAQTSVNLTGNTFASNGTVVGFASGFNGLEFDAFTGSAVVSGNTFSNNTANGIFIGGASQTLQITGNTFDDNLVGLDMDASAAPIGALIQGNTFTGAAGSADQGLVAAGSGVTATIGGFGAAQNTFANYGYQLSILQYHSSGSDESIGCPNLSILTNTYLSGGQAVSSSQAIAPCS